MFKTITNDNKKCKVLTLGGYPRANRWADSGRSMVETLGVLAVMGVLSVAGISTYNSAMNRHRANEILNEASKRAVMVAGQLLATSNVTTISLSQFGNGAVAGATFTDTATINGNHFTLNFMEGKIPEAHICTQMKNLMGEDSIMKIASDCSNITFNADLSRGVTVSTGNNNLNVVSDCTGKEDGTLCDSPTNGDTIYWGICRGGGCGSCQPTCKWTEWFDLDTPEYSPEQDDTYGDFETYENIQVAGYSLVPNGLMSCEELQEIECEAINYPGLTAEQLGQRVHCDKETGFICRNNEQLGLFKSCYDYHIRILCCEWRNCIPRTS